MNQIHLSQETKEVPKDRVVASENILKALSNPETSVFYDKERFSIKLN